ncbi:MAG: HNH endonuclease [Candidatus Omnitrophica bacterium]|nr:HNH endonuclease [Candidatus Omnitrophota bacterium]
MEGYKRATAREISLTQGYNAVVDEGDHARISEKSWHVCIGRSGVRAVRNSKKEDGLEKRTTVIMAREVLGLDLHDGLIVDHRNFDTLDNRKQNLRVCSYAESAQHRRLWGKTSGYKGVRANGGSWEARIRHKGKLIYLGLFKHKEAAAHVYNEAALDLFGEYAQLNTI